MADTSETAQNRKLLVQSFTTSSLVMNSVQLAYELEANDSRTNQSFMTNHDY
jgi:hypothetical protein